MSKGMGRPVGMMFFGFVCLAVCHHPNLIPTSSQPWDGMGSGTSSHPIPSLWDGIGMGRDVVPSQTPAAPSLERCSQSGWDGMMFEGGPAVASLPPPSRLPLGSLGVGS